MIDVQGAHLHSVNGRQARWVRGRYAKRCECEEMERIAVVLCKMKVKVKVTLHRRVQGHLSRH